MKFKNKIKIKLNGKKVIFNKNESIEILIKKLKIPLNKVAIELNKKILDKRKIKRNTNTRGPWSQNIAYRQREYKKKHWKHFVIFGWLILLAEQTVSSSKV